MNHVKSLCLLAILLSLGACGDTPDETEPLCPDGCGPNQVCARDDLCACDAGFRNCDGSDANGCEVEGLICPECQGETDEILCAAAGAGCGSVVATDACGETRSVECGGCLDGEVCGVEIPRVCVRPDVPCEPETDAELCDALLTACGPGEAIDRCGTARTFTCGSCPAGSYCAPNKQCKASPPDPVGEGGTCLRDGEAVAVCAEGLKCIGDWDLGNCTRTCEGDGECSGGKVCREAMVDPELYEPGLSTCQEKEVIPPPVCDELPKGSACATFQSFRHCVAGDGGQPLVAESRCNPLERCEEGPSGAQCVSLGAGCAEGHGYCTSVGAGRTCEQGRFETFSCSSGWECGEAATGVFCRDPTLEVFRGEVFYEHRLPNAALTGWGAPEERPAAGLLVYSARGTTILDRGIVAEDGSFEIRLPRNRTSSDVIVLYAWGRSLRGGGPLYTVTDPGLPPGTWSAGEYGDAETWRWSIDPAGENRAWVIREAHGSGAAQIFANIRKSVETNGIRYGLANDSLEVWYHPDIEWDCGGCFRPSTSEIFLSGGDTQGYGSSDSVILHESGHYTMSAHGVSPGEGGTHCVGVPVRPGMAWSEGYATWYASDLQNNSVHFDLRDGTAFYFDIEARTGGGWGNWFTPPSPSLGLLQDMNETWVSAILWSLGKKNGDSLPLWNALVSREMTRFPFGRGYVRHAWWQVDQNCRAVNPTPTGESSPMVADFLDALLCGGFPASHISSTVLPAYPFPVHAPICR